VITPPVLSLDESSAHDRALTMLAPGSRSVLGLAGPPGAGKSTFAEKLVGDLRAAGHPVALLPMDGFHLAHSVLVERGLEGVKGAPETFDAAGYVALLRRLRDPGEDTVWAPRFDRALEDAIAGSIPIPKEVRLVVTEGNYLLLDHGPWAEVRRLLDQCWFLEVDSSLRRRRLASRHARHGRPAVEARERALGSDEANARVVWATRSRADAALRLRA